jgi:hypothetical protein
VYKIAGNLQGLQCLLQKWIRTKFLTIGNALKIHHKKGYSLFTMPMLNCHDTLKIAQAIN